MLKIREILAKVRKGELSNEEASNMLVAEVSNQDMADFIIDAFSREWITRFNLGIDDDGNLI